MNLDGYAEYAGLVYPAWDRKMPRILQKSLSIIDRVLEFVPNRGVVVQAGGNCGLWPRKLGEVFETVYTFEPDHENFIALALNTRGCPNVVKFQAALGDEAAFVDMQRTPEINCGAHFVAGPGIHPVMTIDALGLTSCDLIYLDIEGRELAALRGAEKTISALKPTIGFEDNGCSERYGVKAGETQEWLSSTFGYRVTETISSSDIIMVAE